MSSSSAHPFAASSLIVSVAKVYSSFPFAVILIHLTLTSYAGTLVHKINLDPNFPITRVIEIIETESTKLESSKFHKTVNKRPNSDLVIGEDVKYDSQIVFECTASYPVQWVYNGDGMPEYSTNTSVSREESSSRRSKYSAAASIGFQKLLSPQDTGKYTCKSLQDPNLSVFYYLYAGNQDKLLFANKGGEIVYYRHGDETVRIPCSVANPKAVVTLQKSLNGVVQCPLNDSISFERTKGFYLKLSDFHNAAGVYICTAGFNDSFQVAKYTLKLSEEPARVSCEYNSDCPDTEACHALNCVSPCKGFCGVNADCKTVRHTPLCNCLPGFIGDAYKSCYRNGGPTTDRPSNHPEQIRDPCTPNPCGPYADCDSNNRFISCACQQGYIGQPPRCRPECEYDGDCPYDRGCINLKCRNPCDGACGSFRKCRVVNRKPVCSLCQPRFAGEGCRSLNINKTSTEENSKEMSMEILHSNLSKVCKPNPCGRNALCRVELTFNRVYNTTAEVALCRCKSNYFGDAYEECFSLQRHDADNSQSPEVIDEGEQEDPIAVNVESVNSTTSDSECKCGKGAICNSESGCSCPQYLEGNPYIECTRRRCNNSDDCGDALESPVCTFNECHEALKITIAKRCGANAFSTVINGKVACSCPENYSGIPTIECHPIVQREVVTSNYSETPCESSPCGKNAFCILKNGIAVCECKNRFLGNPLIGCELQCTSDTDCPSTYSCFAESQVCVNPCASENQHFYTLCGTKAKCKVSQHIPVCYCPDGLIYGSPLVHCKEKSWMRDSPPVKEECSDIEAGCGPNAQCLGRNHCECQPGFYGDPYGLPGCQTVLQCRINSDCPTTQECFNGKCLDPCRKNRTSCNTNSGCRTENHEAICTCKIGTYKNAEGECEPVTGALAEKFALFRAFEDFE